MGAQLRRNPQVRALGMLGGLVLLAGLLSLGNVSLVRAAGATIGVVHRDGALPIAQPFDKAWDAAQEASIPLSAQQMWQPGGGSVSAVQVKALENGQDM